MENPMQTPSRSTHPMILVAATSVTIASLAGLASIAGWLPSSHNAPATPVAQTSTAAQTVAPIALATPLTPAPTEKAATINVPPGSSINVNTGEDRPARRAAAPRRPAAAVATLPPPAPAQAPVAEVAPGYGARGAMPIANTPVNDSGIHVENSRQPQSLCRDCGTIEGIREVAQEGQGTGLGAVAGTVLGGILGHQVGNGNGRDIATVVGALGGAYAGHTVEKNARSSQQYEVTVRLDDGSMRTITEAQQPQWRSGDRVRVNNNRLASL